MAWPQVSRNPPGPLRGGLSHFPEGARSEDPRRALDDIEVGGRAGPGPLEGVRDRSGGSSGAKWSSGGAQVCRFGVVAGNDTEFRLAKRAIAGNSTFATPASAPTPSSVTRRASPGAGGHAS